MAIRLPVLVVFAVSLLHAGPIDGVVKDPSGASVPHCPVALDGPTTFNTETDAQGQFHFPQAPNGPYQLTVTCDGFETAAKTVVSSDAPLALTIELKIAVQETAVE